MDKLLEQCEIMCLQETWLAKHDLDGLNALHPNFHGAGESINDLRDKMVRIEYRQNIGWCGKLDPVVTVVGLNVDWAIGIEFKCNDRTFIILNIHTSFESCDNVDEYCNRLAFVNAFIEDYGSTCVCSGGL